MIQVDLENAEKQILMLIDLAAQGEEVVIYKNKRPFVKLAAAISNEKKHDRQFGSAKGLITVPDDFDAPLEEFKEYM